MKKVGHRLGFRLLAGWVMCAALGAPVGAVDVPNRNPPPEDRALREAREAIAQRDWARALKGLQPYVLAHPQDADGHNLLGFSLRKLGRYESSQAAYERALALDPSHRGAHEYLGELMLILGRRDRALHHLQVLERLCPTGCEELNDLREALQAQGQRPGAD